jgi:hypothetical protein
MSNATAHLVYGIPLENQDTPLPWYDHESCELNKWWESLHPEKPSPVEEVQHGFPDSFLFRILIIPGMAVKAYRCTAQIVDAADLAEQARAARTDGRQETFQEFIRVHVPFLLVDGKVPEPHWYLACYTC